VRGCGDLCSALLCSQRRRLVSRVFGEEEKKLS